MKCLYVLKFDIYLDLIYVLIILKNIFTLKFYLKYKSLYSKSHSMSEYTHTSFPLKAVMFSRVRNLLKNEILSEMKSSLKLGVVFELLEGMVGFENIHSSFPLRAKTFSRVPNLLWNEVFYETRGRLRTLGRHGWFWKHSLFISPDSENVLKSTQSSLKWTFTLHFPIKNVLQSTQSSLKWRLFWNEVFSETLGRLRTLGRRGRLWINHFPIENVLQSTQSSLKLVAVFELFVRPAFDFPDQLEFFHLRKF